MKSTSAALAAPTTNEPFAHPGIVRPLVSIAPASEAECTLVKINTILRAGNIDAEMLLRIIAGAGGVELYHSGNSLFTNGVSFRAARIAAQQAGAL